jgi:hypothetical protein
MEKNLCPTAGAHCFSDQEDKVIGCLVFRFNEEQRDRDKLDVNRELKGSSRFSIMIEMMQKFAEPFRCYIRLWSHTKGTNCTKSISKIFLSVPSLLQNHWGNPISSTYSTQATAVMVSPLSP